MKTLLALSAALLFTGSANAGHKPCPCGKSQPHVHSGHHGLHHHHGPHLHHGHHYHWHVAPEPPPFHPTFQLYGMGVGTWHTRWPYYSYRAPWASPEPSIQARTILPPW